MNEKYSELKKELSSFFDDIKQYDRLSEFMKDKTQEEIKQYWAIVEYCREVKKKMESIYDRY
jgi:ferritin